MRRSLVLPSVLIAGLISVCGFAQSAGQEPATDSIDQPAADVDVEEATTDSAAGAEEVALRQQYLKLVQQKAELMNETALQGEITQMQRDIEELKAGAELQMAQHKLEELIRAYPDTAAAKTARTMLAASAPPATPFFPGGGAPTYSDPTQFEFQAPRSGTTGLSGPPSIGKPKPAERIPTY